MKESLFTVKEFYNRANSLIKSIAEYESSINSLRHGLSFEDVEKDTRLPVILLYQEHQRLTKELDILWGLKVKVVE